MTVDAGRSKGPRLRPLGHRVIIRPDPPETRSESGLHLLADRTRPEMRGTVVAVGRGPAHAARVRAATLDSCLALIARLGAECQAGPDLARRLTDALRQARAAPMGWSELEPGQVVYFPPTAGSRMVVDGEPWLLMAEDEIAAVWAEEAR